MFSCRRSMSASTCGFGATVAACCEVRLGSSSPSETASFSPVIARPSPPRVVLWSGAGGRDAEMGSGSPRRGDRIRRRRGSSRAAEGSTTRGSAPPGGVGGALFDDGDETTVNSGRVQVEIRRTTTTTTKTSGFRSLRETPDPPRGTRTRRARGIGIGIPASSRRVREGGAPSSYRGSSDEDRDVVIARRSSAVRHERSPRGRSPSAHRRHCRPSGRRMRKTEGSARHPRASLISDDHARPAGTRSFCALSHSACANVRAPRRDRLWGADALAAHGRRPQGERRRRHARGWRGAGLRTAAGTWHVRIQFGRSECAGDDRARAVGGRSREGDPFLGDAAASRARSARRQARLPPPLAAVSAPPVEAALPPSSRARIEQRR